jgi:hypothetical protein
MATTKKRTRRKVAPSEPVAAETKVEEPEARVEDETQKVVAPSPPPEREPEVVAQKEAAPSSTPKPSPKRGNGVYVITLTQGKTYGYKGLNFVVGQPLVTSDAKLYEALRHNGRFRVNVREGGAK